MDLQGNIKLKLGDPDFMEKLELNDKIINETFFVRKEKEVQKDINL